MVLYGDVGHGNTYEEPVSQVESRSGYANREVNPARALTRMSGRGPRVLIDLVYFLVSHASNIVSLENRLNIKTRLNSKTAFSLA